MTLRTVYDPSTGGYVTSGSIATTGGGGVQPASLGQTSMAGSLPVAIANNQSVLTVGGTTALIRPTVTVSLTAYAVGDSIGGEIAVTNAVRVSGGSGVLDSINIHDDDNEKAAMTILIFDSNPAANTADNAVFAFGSGDKARIIGQIDVQSADYITVGGDAVMTKAGIGLAVKASGSADLYLLLIAQGTPTYTSTTDLSLSLGFLQD